MEFLHKWPTTYDVLRKHGVGRRAFLDFCTRTTARMGLDPAMVSSVVKAMVTQPRLPVIWLHGLACTGCSESLLRASHPTMRDIILNLISLDYEDTLQASAGAEVDHIRKKIMHDYAGRYLLAVEGSAPAKDGGVYCIVSGNPFLNVLLETAAGARAIVAWGSCASGGCVQAEAPIPAGAEPVEALITGKPVINVPGCPPVPGVMAGVISYLITTGQIPPLDELGRPTMFFSRTVHDECARRKNFREGRFVRSWDDGGARRGWCLFKMGCRGPMTRVAGPATQWNSGAYSPVDSGHPCIGRAGLALGDNHGPLYRQLAGIPAHGRGHEGAEFARVGGQ